MQRYIDKNNAYLARRAEYIRDVVKKWRFDTIAVHGLYTVAGRHRGLPGLDHRADLHEHLAGLPRLGRDGGGARLPDPDLVLLAHREPLDLLLRVDAGAARGLRLRRRDLLLLDLVGHGGDHDRGPAVPGAHAAQHVHEPRNFVATAQCYGGTFQQFNVRLQQERDIECRWVEDPTNLDEWASKIDENTRFLYGELPSNPQQGFFDIQAVADLAHAHNLPLDRATARSPRRRCCAPSATARTSWCSRPPRP